MYDRICHHSPCSRFYLSRCKGLATVLQPIFTALGRTLHITTNLMIAGEFPDENSDTGSSIQPFG
jgi:hypothetical protein